MSEPREFNPKVAFGLKLQTIALKAKTRQLREVDRSELLLSCMEQLPEHEAARHAVIDFYYGSKLDPIRAGERLYDFIDELCPKIDARKPERVLKIIERERAEDPDAPKPEPETQPHFDWQDRRDLR